MPSKKRVMSSASEDREIAERPHPQLLAVAQHAGDRDHAVLLERQEVAAAPLALQREHGAGHLLVVQALEPEQSPAELDVGHRLDVEHQAALARTVRAAAARTGGCAARAINIATATTSPASSVKVTCPAPMPSLRRKRSPRSRPDDLRLAAPVLHHADVANPHAVGEARAHRLDDRFLGGEAHGEEPLRPRVRSNCARSAGSSSRATKRSPKRR